jgi:hypothetical protein
MRAAGDKIVIVPAWLMAAPVVIISSGYSLNNILKLKLCLH